MKHKRHGPLAAAVALFFSTAASAQVGYNNISYDPLGRVVQIDRLTGSHERYSYDAAGNRIEAIFANFLSPTYNWEAENLYHGAGFADGDGWAANTSTSPTFITYGPYTTFPTGGHTAGWKMLIDDVTTQDPSTYQVELQVYDTRTGELLGDKWMTRLFWPTAWQYYYFAVPFTIDQNHNSDPIEFRTLFFAHSYIRIDRIAAE